MIKESNKSVKSKKQGAGVSKENTGKTKYDWIKIKQEFMASNYIDVAPFLQANYNINTVQSSQSREMTKGWADEKKRIKEEMKEKAMEKFKKNLGKQWEDTFLKLEQAHLRGLDDLVQMLLNQGEVDREIVEMRIRDKDTGQIQEIKQFEDRIYRPRLGQGEIINILKHIKLEKGEPTEIRDNEGKSKTKSWLEEMKAQKVK